MSSSIPPPACRIAAISYSSHRHLVPATSSSRIGYRMISKRNPSHAIPDTMTSASPVHLPAPSHRHTASRPASRRTVSPDGSAQGSTPSYQLLARSPCLLTHLVPSHRLISSAHPFRPLLARLISRTPSLVRLPPMWLIHLIRPASSHRVHLPSRSASRSASRRASRLTYLPASFISSISSISSASLHLIGSSPCPIG